MAEFMCSLKLVFPSVIDINCLMREVNALKKINSMPAAMSCLGRQFFVPVEVEIQETGTSISLNVTIFSLNSRFFLL